jgi:hypothetical protein
MLRSSLDGWQLSDRNSVVFSEAAIRANVSASNISHKIIAPLPSTDLHKLRFKVFFELELKNIPLVKD